MMYKTVSNNIPKKKVRKQTPRNTRQLLRNNCSVLIPLGPLILDLPFKFLNPSFPSSNGIYQSNTLGLCTVLHWTTTAEKNRKIHTNQIKNTMYTYIHTYIYIYIYICISQIWAQIAKKFHTNSNFKCYVTESNTWKGFHQIIFRLSQPSFNLHDFSCKKNQKRKKEIKPKLKTESKPEITKSDVFETLAPCLFEELKLRP